MTQPEIPQTPATLQDLINAALLGQSAAAEGIDRGALRELLSGLGIELPATMEDLEDAAEELLRAQENLGQFVAAGESPQIIESLRERVGLAASELVRVAQDKFGLQGGDVSRSISEYIDRSIVSREMVGRTEEVTTARYLDIPTPEEFLDDFSVALATHVQGLVEAGELGRDTAMWIMENPNVVLTDYLGELGQRAAAGEEIFAPVGLEGEPELLGERPGRQEAGVTETKRGSVTEAVSQAQQTALATQAGVSQVAGTATTTREKTVRDEEQVVGAKLKETEEVFARPRLGYVSKMSPLEFLAEQAPAQNLIFRAEREKSRRQVAGRRPGPSGPTVVTPRRVR